MPGETEAQAREFEAIKEKVMDEVTKSGKTKLKIAGHKAANYEACINVLAMAQANGWEPVLAYQK
jgi:biopolymer transport protein ExbD